MISTKKDLETKYLALLNDTSINELEALLKVPNLFEILRIEKFEIRHSNFLAWLLDPKGNHGIGTNFIKKFLYDVAIDDRSHTFSVFEVNNLNFESVRIHRELYSIDILIVFDNYVFIIENKINHKETADQLVRYKQSIEKSFKKHKVVCVFLNVDGYESTQKDIYINFSFESIIKYLEQLLEIDTTINYRSRIYIEDYINSVKNNIMENSEKYALANKIYKNHKEVFDFILSNRLDFYKDLKNALKEKIQKEKKDWKLTSTSSTFIRFITKNLEPVIASKTQTGYTEWQTGEVFLFEIYFGKSQNYVNPYYTVSRANHPQREVLLDILKVIYEPDKDKNAWNMYRANNPIPIDEILGIDDKSYIDMILNSIIERADAIVKEAEGVILPHKEELIKIK